MSDFITNRSFELKRSQLVRSLAYPCVNILRQRRKKTFYYTRDGRYIASFKNKYQGKRCFIIGNGPSLRAEDLDCLCGEICFGTNRIYTVFKNTKWKPQFYFALDAEIIHDNIREINDMQVEHIFLDIIGKKYHNVNPNIHYFFNYSPFVVRIPSLANISYSEEMEKYVGMGYTVTYACMQFALYMGFKEVYLLGMDHSFSQVINTQGVIQKHEGIVDHFNEDRNDTRIFQFSDGVNFAYELAKQKAEQKDARILNATRGGKLEIFQRCDFDKLIAGKQE